MLKRILLTSVACVCFTAPAAFAQNAAPRRHPLGINERQHHQADRIRTARRQGELTRLELRRLRGAELRIRAEERRFRRSGDGLNRREFRTLQRDLNRASRQIRRAAHNRRGL
jgi:hypothetical protein